MIVVEKLTVITDKEREFIDELEALCKKYTEGNSNDFWFTWEIEK